MLILKVICLTLILWFGGKSGLSFGSFSFPEIGAFQAFVIGICVYVSAGGHYTLWLIYKTLPRDLRALYRFVKMRMTLAHAQRNNLTVPKLFAENVKKNPNKLALICGDVKWSFADIEEYSNRIAHYLLSIGMKRNDSLSLFMENKPEYVATWLGCSKIGVIPALINTHLRRAPLIHSIKIVNSRAIICGEELQNAVHDICAELGSITILVSGLGSSTPVHGDFVNMDSCLSRSAPTPVNEIDGGSFSDHLLYIYTSGTTGLPKAAIIKNSRFLMFAVGVNCMADINEEVIYNPLPLYHTAGGMAGVGQTLIHNCTCVIRKKFSASNFWLDCVKHQCTVAQYVGEMCRYLLNTPSRPEEIKHNVRLLYGNGLRPQIWEDFVERFKIPKIMEVYGATEGIANIINFEGIPGACGFLPVLFPDVYPARLIRVDQVTGEPLRDENGLCIFCKPGEPGEFIGKIRHDPTGDFHGYADKKATEKKIVRDVFQKGDSAFLSGDILVMDELGYVFFKDRLGDTFRWRGENVSTTEVEGLVSQLAENRDAVVYGVEVPFCEGKAGMAAIVDPNGNLDLKGLAKDLQELLPPYALPLFIRILSEIDMTGTFKLKKKDLQKSGFDLESISDKLYFFDSKQKTYVDLTNEIFEKIKSGKAGL